MTEGKNFCQKKNWLSANAVVLRYTIPSSEFKRVIKKKKIALKNQSEVLLCQNYFKFPAKNASVCLGKMNEY